MDGQLVTFPQSHSRGYTRPSKSSYADTQRALAVFNRDRLAPGLGESVDEGDMIHRRLMLVLENDYLTQIRAKVAPLLKAVPATPEAFVRWYEHLKEIGPGQHDSLFPWLAAEASYEQFRWFLEQEVAGEAGFDDLVAMTQVKMPTRAKLEMARNYWDEMGRGDAKGMHGPMLDRLAAYFELRPEIDTTVPEALALGNMMVALATNRRFAFQAAGALGIIELTAPTRAVHVVEALDRLGVPKKESHYFSLHAILDVKHSQHWNAEILEPLVAEDPRRAAAIAEGALLRLWCGQQCFIRYRREFGLSDLLVS